MKEIEFKAIPYSEAISFLIDKHYSGRKPNVKYSFGAFYKGELVCVCTYGVPASRPLCVGVLGKQFYDKVIELNRLLALPDIIFNLSQFVSWTLKQLQEFNLVIISYSDTGMGHCGIIYQACNFIYTGVTKQRTDKYTEGNKHSRHYNNENTHLRKVRTAKHRYIYFTCNRSIKKVYLKNLNYKIEPYPKTDKTNYVLGEFLKTKVINSLSNEITYV